MRQKKTDEQLLREANELDEAYARAAAFDAQQALIAERDRAVACLRAIRDWWSGKDAAKWSDYIDDEMPTEIFDEIADILDQHPEREDESETLRKAALNRGQP